MLDCFKAQERVNGPKEQEDKTLRIKDTSGLHLYRVRPSHSFTPGGGARVHVAPPPPLHIEKEETLRGRPPQNISKNTTVIWQNCWPFVLLAVIHNDAILRISALCEIAWAIGSGSTGISRFAEKH